eukprot:CAMPEP_0119507468 /NCGR_PEP_ID=MMETSP1344-20130328/27351_1 /TAXON_ID=236787 /ORGANISM="Florenciella parvula, Strain CCMP2471" /LENGTH=69 /DNA_ID=CAMNT_0007544103 /DNA_START=151 /DNA_END=357 /DNA_ORIENTATION=-
MDGRPSLAASALALGSVPAPPPPSPPRCLNVFRTLRRPGLPPPPLPLLPGRLGLVPPLESILPLLDGRF